MCFSLKQAVQDDDHDGVVRIFIGCFVWLYTKGCLSWWLVSTTHIWIRLGQHSWSLAWEPLTVSGWVKHHTQMQTRLST